MVHAPYFTSFRFVKGHNYRKPHKERGAMLRDSRYLLARHTSLCPVRIGNRFYAAQSPVKYNSWIRAAFSRIPQTCRHYSRGHLRSSLLTIHDHTNHCQNSFCGFRSHHWPALLFCWESRAFVETHTLLCMRETQLLVYKTQLRRTN